MRPVDVDGSLPHRNGECSPRMISRFRSAPHVYHTRTNGGFMLAAVRQADQRSSFDSGCLQYAWAHILLSHMYSLGLAYPTSCIFFFSPPIPEKKGSRQRYGKFPHSGFRAQPRHGQHLVQFCTDPITCGLWEKEEKKKKNHESTCDATVANVTMDWALPLTAKRSLSTYTALLPGST